MSPRVILEEIQAQQFGKKITYNRDEELDSCIQGILDVSEHLLDNESKERIIDEYRSVAKIIPSRYQSLAEYTVLRRMFIGLEEVVKKESLKKQDGTFLKWKNIPVFGTVKLNKFSAYIIPTENKDPLILFSDSFVAFSGLFCKCMLLLPLDYDYKNGRMYFDISKKYFNEIESNTAIIGRFIDLIVSYMLTGNPNRADKYFADRRFVDEYTTLNRGFTTFIIGHEYAHYLLGHSGVKSILDLEKEEAYNKIIDNHAQEINADVLGATITKRRLILNDDDEYFLIIGIYFALKTIDLINRIENLKHGRNEYEFFSSTHPSFEERRYFFIDRVVKNNNEVIDQINLLDDVIDYMWNEFKNLFMRAIKLIGTHDFWKEENIDVILYSMKDVLYNKYPIN